MKSRININLIFKVKISSHHMLKLELTLSKEIKISNIVTTADLKQKVDIEKLNDYPWGIYDQISYRGVCAYVKTPEMKGRVSIFATGKMISIGSNVIEDSFNKLNQAKFYLLKENLIKEVELVPLVRNSIAVMTTPKKIDLNNLSLHIPNSVYEPEKFAGLRYKIKDGLSILIFQSGKIVIAGGKSIQELNDIGKLIKAILNDYAKIKTKIKVK